MEQVKKELEFLDIPYIVDTTWINGGDDLKDSIKNIMDCKRLMDLTWYDDVIDKTSDIYNALKCICKILPATGIIELDRIEIHNRILKEIWKGGDF